MILMTEQREAAAARRKERDSKYNRTASRSYRWGCIAISPLGEVQFSRWFLTKRGAEAYGVSLHNPHAIARAYFTR